MSIENVEKSKAASQSNSNNINCEESENNTVNFSEDQVTLRTNSNKNSIVCGEINGIENGNKISTAPKPLENTSSSKSDSEEDPVPVRLNNYNSAAPVKIPVLIVDEPMDTAEAREVDDNDIALELKEKIIISEAKSLPIPNDILCKLKAQVRTLKRSDLETLIMDKILQAIATNSDVGVLSQKLIQSNIQRDRLFYKISNLQRQVTELQKAVRPISENEGRNQENFNKANKPIRFCRTVGVQVDLKGNLSSQQTQARGDSSNSILKSENNTAIPITSVKNNCEPQIKNVTIIKPLPRVTSKNPETSSVPTSALVIPGNGNPGLKRLMTNPSLTVSEISKQVESQVQAQTKIRRVGSDDGMTTTAMSNGVFLYGVTGAKGSAPVNSNAATAPNPVRQRPPVHQIRNPAAAAAIKALNAMSENSKAIDNGVVDLTDDDDLHMMIAAKGTDLPGANTSLIVNSSTASNVVLQPPGPQQYRFLSPPQPLQFIQTGKSYYQLVTPAGASTNRPGLISSRQIRPTTGAAPNQILRASSVQMSSAQGTPIITNTVRFVLSRFPATVRPPLSTMAPMVGSKQHQTNLIRSRPGAPMTTAQLVPQQTCTNGTGMGSCVMTRQQMRGGGGPTLTQVGTGTSIETALKKFVLPPLPPPAITGQPGRCSKDIPPRPELTLMEQSEGIVLSWTLKVGSHHSEIETYQIYACQEPSFSNQKAAAWARVGNVKALPLPMACTLSQFTDESRYHFIIRGVDVYNRTGPFCEPTAISITLKGNSKEIGAQ